MTSPRSRWREVPAPQHLGVSWRVSRPARAWGRWGLRLREPVPGVLLEPDGGWLLLDVGFPIRILWNACT